MHQSDDQDQEQSENWLGTFELECVNQLQSEPNLEETMVTERGLSEKQLFLMFQDSASAISQLYKGIVRFCMDSSQHYKQNLRPAKLSNLSSVTVSRVSVCASVAADSTVQNTSYNFELLNVFTHFGPPKVAL